jgi:hypothetical protein
MFNACIQRVHCSQGVRGHGDSFKYPQTLAAMHPLRAFGLVRQIHMSAMSCAIQTEIKSLRNSTHRNKSHHKYINEYMGQFPLTITMGEFPRTITCKYRVLWQVQWCPPFGKLVVLWPAICIPMSPDYYAGRSVYWKGRPCWIGWARHSTP